MRRSWLKASVAGWAIGVGMAVVLAPSGGWAQISPNCQLNDKPLACAITPGEEEAPDPKGMPTSSTLTVMYSDGQAFRLTKLENRCRHQGMRSTCPATIVPNNGFGTPISGTYRGQGYEGGYRHDYSGGGVRIVYFFVD